MGLGGGAEGLASSTMAKRNWQQDNDGFCDSLGSGGTCVVYERDIESKGKNNSKKFRRLGKAAVSFDADQLGTQRAHPGMDKTSTKEIEQNLKAAREENLRLKAENEILIRSLIVKSDILKATLTAKHLHATIEQPALEQKRQNEINDEEQCSCLSHRTKTKVSYPDQNAEAVVKAVAIAAAGGTCTPMDSEEPAVAKLTTSLATGKQTTYPRQSSYSFNRNPGSDTNDSDATSNMIVIRSHQGDLKLLLQEAEEEGLSSDLMANIESTVAETSKIYSNIMSRRRQHPALNNLMRDDGKLKLNSCGEIKVNHRSIAAAILERLSQQELMSLHGSWKAHTQKSELNQQKQARLEVMRASLANAIQKRDEHAARAGKSDLQNVNWKARASALLAFDYLAKTGREVCWEEWDAIDKFEGTCCRVSRVVIIF